MTFHNHFTNHPFSPDMSEREEKLEKKREAIVYKEPTVPNMKHKRFDSVTQTNTALLAKSSPEETAEAIRLRDADQHPTPYPTTQTLSPDQTLILDFLLKPDGKQKLAMVHGGGGTGKSTINTIVYKMIEERRKRAACTSPTGVAAGLLPGGRTFAGLFHTKTSLLNMGKIMELIKADLGGNDLEQIIIDKVSMLSAEDLVLIGTRLRAMYDHSKMFSGISILLSGDFLQLKCTGGTDLYKHDDDHEEAPRQRLCGPFALRNREMS
jgi:hypothetical protein